MTTAGVVGPARRTRSGLELGVALWWCLVLAAVTVAVRLALDLRADGLPADSDADMVASVVAALGGAGVAAGVVLRAPRNPVGWLLMGLFTVFALDGVASFYPQWADHHRWPLAGAVAGLGDPAWVLELGLLGLAVLRVPDGRPARPGWRRVGVLLALLTPLTYLSVLLIPDGARSTTSTGVANPFAVAALDSGPGQVVRAALAVSSDLLLVACVASLVDRYRHSGATVRRQLGWVLLGATTVPAFVVALVAARLATGSEGAATIIVETAGFDAVLVGVPLSIALAMARYRLYSVDAVVDSTVAWLAASGVLLLGFAMVVVAMGSLPGTSFGGSPVAVAVTTCGVVLAARPLHRVLQRGINRRFHRRSYDAVDLVENYVAQLREGTATLDELEATLRRAVGDPGLEVAVPVGEQWVRMDGSPAADPAQCTAFEARRDGLVVARLSPSRVARDDRALVAAAAAAALPLETARLRAQTVLQLAEVTASRQRIVAAHYEERRRLERDLHDGAQQRLMAALMALSLAAKASAHDRASLALVSQASVEVTAAMHEVRHMGQGLHPAVLTEEGLLAAIESVADRAPIPTTLEVPQDVAEGLTDEQAAAVYFGVCECLTNAVRNQAGGIRVAGARLDGWVRFEVTDDGPGGAWIRPGGGLSGLSDRFSAGGGRIAVSSPLGIGTTVRLELPCGS